MAGTQPKKWATWLPLAEWWYNTNYHTATGMTPYQALYGVPLTHYGIEWVTTTNEEVTELLRDHSTTIGLLKGKLKKAQERMKHYANREGQTESFRLGIRPI